MKTNKSIHLKKKLKFLISNLEQGAELFTTPEGKKAYYRSLLIEIPQITTTVKECIILINKNTVLFPNQSLFKTDFVQLSNEIQIAWELMQEDHSIDKCLTSLDKAIQDLRKQLQIAHTSLNTPDAKKMLEFFQVLWNKFEQNIWPSKNQELQAKVFAGLSHTTSTRRRQLNNYIKSAMAKLNSHTIAVLKQLELEGDLMDEISENGHIVAEALAPTIFNNRDELHDNQRIYDFFTLFMTYQTLKDEYDKAKVSQEDEAQKAMIDWFCQLAVQLQPVVKPEYKQTFPQLIHLLCQNASLNSVMKTNTLQGPYNLKLAYNLFGVMFDNGIFTVSKVAPLRKLVSSSRQDEYFKEYLYTDFDSYTSELTDSLLNETRHIIEQWKNVTLTDMRVS